MDKAGYKKLLNLDNHKCFGCSPVNPSGLQMEFYSKGDSLFSWVIVPDHMCGWHNVVHGGIISTILDEIMGRSSIYLLKKFVMTKSITVDFIKPIFVGKELRAEGKVIEIKNDREAEIGGFLYNEEEELCAKATGQFALFTPDALRKMGLTDEQLLEGLERLMAE
jgi:uncharacterized protein (TIGR00369 family)